MRKALLLLIIALIPALYGVAPSSRKIGPVIVSIESGSISETALAAVSEPFTEEWLERYTSDPMAAGEVLSPVLSSVLPLANGSVYSFIFRDGKIASCYPSYSPDSPEL